jgi:PAS domain-containing protein
MRPLFIRLSHWTVTARWLLIAVLLATSLAGRELIARPGSLLVVCAAMILYNVATAASRWAWSHVSQATFVTLLLDLAALTTYLRFAGDVENPLRVLLLLPAAIASIALSLRAGLAVAAWGMLLYGLLACLTWIDALPLRLVHYHLELFDPAIHSVIDPESSSRGSNYLLLHLLRFSLMMFGAAVGFGLLGGRLREAGMLVSTQHEQLRVLLNVLPDGVVLLSADGRISHSNWAAREYLHAWNADHLSDLDASGGIKERVRSFRGYLEEFETTDGNVVLHHTLAASSEEGAVVWLIRDVTKARRKSSVAPDP